jgi:LacI family transcriptional regulator
MGRLTSKKRILILLNFTFPGYLRGVQRYLLLHPEIRPLWYLANTLDRREVARLRATIDRFRPHGVLAWLFPEFQELLESIPQPVVNIEDDIVTTLPTIIIDQTRMGAMAAQHLLEQGLKHFGFGAVRAGALYAKSRRRAFVGTLREAGFACSVFRGQSLPSDQTVDPDRLRQWVAELPKPVGLHLATCALGVQVIWACQELGLHVPRDVAVLGGADKTELTNLWDPPLTAFDNEGWLTLSFEAMKLLERLIDGEPRPAGRILLPPGAIIKRASSDVKRASDPKVDLALRLILDNAHRPLGVKELLAGLSLSRRALERRFLKVTGHTLHRQIVLAHMNRAMTLLKQTKLPIAQVAAQSGYSDYRVFTTAFRKHTGLTPRKYRAQWLRVSGDAAAKPQ